MQRKILNVELHSSDRSPHRDDTASLEHGSWNAVAAWPSHKTGTDPVTASWYKYGKYRDIDKL
jgi:hypothetical protein